MLNVYLGVDVGSVSTNIIALDENGNLLAKVYERTRGNPIQKIQDGLDLLHQKLIKIDEDILISGVGATGSGRQLASILIGADIVKNEITAHAVAAISYEPEVRTILEIGGQDSKIILLRDNIVYDFAMNTVCAAGTGSFLDRQASRLDIPIEEFGDLALKSTNQVRIAGRCAVFAESDMIHKQQLGYSKEDIINGLCEAMVRNYLNNLGKGKDIESPVLFQGGVAANKGIKKAFEKALNCEVLVPKHHDVMGAIGAAILAKEEVLSKQIKSNFYGFKLTNCNYNVKGFECKDCPNVCEVVGIYRDDELVARWGDRCGKWSNLITNANANAS